jgi:hypothetical protein
MKTHWDCFFIVFILLLVIKLVEYCRFIKIHKKQMEDLEGLLNQLKNKQLILNQHLKVIKQSEKYQKTQFEIISQKIYETIDNYLKNKNHD